MAYATRCGLTVADFKILSIGFVVDYCIARSELESGDNNDEEKKYIMLKKNYSIIRDKYERGEISEEKYQSFMKRYEKMEALYGFDY